MSPTTSIFWKSLFVLVAAISTIANGYEYGGHHYTPTAISAARVPAATATEMQFSRDNVVPFQPGGMASSREWIQIDRAEAGEYEKDLELFQASLEFVKAARTR